METNVAITEEVTKVTVNEEIIQIKLQDEVINVSIKESYNNDAQYLQGIPISTTTPSEGDILTYSSADGWHPEARNQDFIFEAGEDIISFSVVYMDTKIYKSDSSDVNLMNRTLGIAVNSVLSGDNVKIRTRGILEELSWNWDVTKPIYFNSLGELTQTQPTTGFFQIVAFPLSNTKIFINPQDCIRLI